MIVVDKGLNPIEDRNKKAEDVCGLYGLRLMHRLNIFLSCFGHSGWDKCSTFNFEGVTNIQLVSLLVAKFWVLSI